jgi:hypothetical protein
LPTMKLQYLGNENDYRKFALLRALADRGRFRIGINWLMTRNEEDSVAGTFSYLVKPEKWRCFEPEVFDYLTQLSASPSMSSLRQLERSGFIPGAASLGDEYISRGEVERQRAHRRCLLAFDDRQLVFFDPNIGLEVESYPRGSRRSVNYVYYTEVEDHYREGRSVLIYQQFARAKRSRFIELHRARLIRTLPGCRVWVFESPRVVFLLAAQPHHLGRVKATASEAERKGWLPRFFRSIHAPRSS